MKNWKEILALILVAGLFAGLFAACADSGSGVQQDDSSAQNSAENTGEKESGNAPVDQEPVDEQEEMSTIEFYFFDFTGTGQDSGERIAAAVNELTEERINTHVNMTFIGFGDMATKATMGIAGGEQIDVLCLTPLDTASSLHASNMLMDITDLMQEYAPETLELLGSTVDAYIYDGKLYGLPTYRNFCSNSYIAMNKQVLEELGMLEQARNISSWSEYEVILQAVYENYAGTGMYPLVANVGSVLTGSNYLLNGDAFADIEVFDNLSDRTGVVYVSPEGVVGLRQSQPGYVEGCQKTQEWFEKGWIYPDSLYGDANGDEMMKQQVSFSLTLGAEYGIETTKSASYGYDVVCVQYVAGQIRTSNLANWGIGIPITAEETEAAAKFINMLYTDGELMTLLIWGQEGTDYELVDDQAKQIGSNYYYQGDFICGNNCLLTPLYGNGADFYDEVLELNQSSESSPYLGFALATSELDLLISQISAVNDQYAQTMQSGGYTEQMYQEYLDKLEAAGVQDYLSEVQTQLDAWLAAK